MTNTEKNQTSFANILSVLAVIIALGSLLFTLRETYNRDSFNLLMSENRETGQDVELFIPKDGSPPYLTVPVTILVTNASGISQPVSKVDITVDENWIPSWDEIYETDGNKMMLPKNIEPKTSLGILVIIHIPLEQKTAQDIRDAYGLPPDTSTAKLGTLKEYRQKTSLVKYSQDQTLYSLSQKHVKVDFWFLSASLGGPSSSPYTLILP